MKTQHSSLLILAILTVFYYSCSNSTGIIKEIDLLPVKSGSDFQYIDTEGKIAINPQFSEATIFREDLALVRTSSDEPKWGFINKEGKYEISPNFKSATIFSDGFAWVITDNSAPSAIDKKGQIKFTLSDAEEVRIYSENLAAFKQINNSGDAKWGFVDKIGKVVINPQFSETRNFVNGKCAVKNKDGKWGYITKDGKIDINYQFDEAGDFINNKAIVKYQSKRGIIDNKGKYTINPQFNNIFFDGNIFMFSQDGKWGWCDSDGKFLINPQFSQAFPFGKNNLAAVKSGNSWGYVNKEGKFIINPQFEYALSFNGKLALVVNSDKIGFINSEGKYEINPQFDGISKDYLNYLFGSSEFESIKSDYFNIGAITSNINFDSPDGFSATSTILDVMNKYKLSESDFSRYEDYHILYENKDVSGDASLGFGLFGNPYTKSSVERYSYFGSYYDTEYNFDNEYKPVYFYVIQLKNKGIGKEDAVLKAIDQSLSDMKKVEEKIKNAVGNIYKKDNKVVLVFKNNDGIGVLISYNSKGIDIDNI
jgi:hypothetical protein